MLQRQTDAILHHIHRFAGARPGPDLSDGELIERFTQGGDEAAFTVLVRRHASLVWSVCRRLLRDAHDAEDAFQATFLVLARHAASIRKRQAAGWPYGVAYRTAMSLKRSAGRCRRRERRAEARTVQEPVLDAALRELQELLDAEVARLVEKYRAPFVLCCLEGKSKAEAARELGWKEGTVSSRVARAREQLRKRLSERGVVLSTGLCALALSAAPAAPAALALQTARDVLLSAAGNTAGRLSARSVMLADGVIKALTASAMKVSTLVVLAIAMCIAGATGWTVYQTVWAMQAPPLATSQPENETPAAKPRTEKLRPRTDRFGDALPPGAIARLGTTRFHQGISAIAAFSPDGKRLLVAGAYGEVGLWETETGKLCHRFRFPGRLRPGRVAFSPDGNLAALSGLNPFVFDVATGQTLHVLGKVATAVAVGTGPGNGCVAAAAIDKVIELRDAVAGNLLRQLHGHQGGIWALDFTADGATLASGSVDGTVRVWDTATGKELRRMPGPEAGASSVRFSRDGKLVACGGDDQSIRLYEMPAGRELRVFKQSGGPGPCAVAFAPDNRRLASGNADGTIALWNVTAGKELRRWRAHQRVNSVAFSLDGKALVSHGVGASGPQFWDTATGKRLRAPAGHDGRVDQLFFSADGKALFSKSFDDRSVLNWDVSTGEEPQRWELPPCLDFGCQAVSQDGKLAATGEDRDAHVELRHLATGETCQLPRLPPGNQKSVPDKNELRFLALAFSPDGQRLAYSGLNKGTVIVCNQIGAELQQFSTGLNVRRLAFSADGTMLAIGGLAGVTPRMEIQLWDVRGRKRLRAIASSQNLISMAFSPDGKLLAGGHEYEVRVFEVATGKELTGLASLPHGAYQVQFSPNGRLLAASGAGANFDVVLCELATGLELRRFGGHYPSAWSIAFTPDGRCLATGGTDSTILLWDLTGRADDRPSRPMPLTPAAQEACWTALAGSDGPRVLRAHWDLVGAPQQSVTLLRDRLPIVARPDAQRLARLVADLNNDAFAVRSAAEAELSTLGELAGPALRKAQADRPTLETQQRLERLLKLLEGPVRLPDRRRQVRAVAVLETINTPEARRLLKYLATGFPEARLTREAKAALERLGR